MGGYDSSQIADLLGLYIFDTLSRIVSPDQMGLYYNDGIIYLYIVMALTAHTYKRRL